MRITSDVPLLAEEAGSLDLSVMQQSRSMTRVGYVISCLFLLQGVVVVAWAIWFPASFSFYSSMGSPQGGGFLGIGTKPIVVLLLVGMGLLMINSQPRDEWVAWGALTWVPAMRVLYDWLSGMDGLVRISVEMILIGCYVYALGVFRRRLKRAQIPSSPNAGPATG